MAIVTFTLTPVAEGFYAAGVQVGGASRVATVQTNDGDTSYMSFPSGLKEETFTVTQLHPAATDITTPNPSMTNVERSNGAFTGVYKHRWHQNATNVDVDYSGTITTSYVSYTDSRATAPDLSAWSVAKINTMEIGGFCNGVTAGEPRLTQTFATVAAILSSGGTSFLLMEWLGPVIGAGLILKDLARISAALRRASGHYIRPEHQAAVLEDLRSWAWPSYFFRPGALVQQG